MFYIYKVICSPPKSRETIHLSRILNDRRVFECYNSILFVFTNCSLSIPKFVHWNSKCRNHEARVPIFWGNFSQRWDLLLFIKDGILNQMKVWNKRRGGSNNLVELKSEVRSYVVHKRWLRISRGLLRNSVLINSGNFNQR